MVVAVALGGAVGALARWGLSESFPVGPDVFPWTTFTINLVGSAVLAVLPAVALFRRRTVLAPALGTGVLGGFTTLSTYSEETRSLLNGGHAGIAAAYLLGTLGACLLAVTLVDRAVDRRPGGPGQRARYDAEEGDL